MNDEKQALVPKLRFPEYVGQRLRKALLKAVTAESGERVGDNFSTMQVMGVSKMEGIVPMEGRLISSDISRYKIVRKNWFAYNPMRLNIGSIARWKGEQNILVSPDYVVFKCLNGADLQIDPEYLNHFRQSDVWKQFVTEGGDGSVRVRIYYRDLARLQLLLPGRDEQQKISDCLSSLDALIAAQADKLDVLKTHKKWLMQQLFPREGETVPRLRFPEFRDMPEWVERGLGNICKIQRGKFSHRPRNDPRFFGGKYPFIQTGDVVKSNGGSVLASQTLNELGLGVSKLFKPPIVLITIAANIGDTGLLDREACFTDSVAGLIPNRGVSVVFLELAVREKKEHLNKIAPAAAQKNINNEILSALPILMPSLDEQKRIADCFSSLDALIAAHAEKLNALKIHKKGLMQQLFPSSEA